MNRSEGIQSKLNGFKIMRDIGENLAYLYNWEKVYNGDEIAAKKHFDTAVEYVVTHEDEIQPVIDTMFFNKI